jgi:hypothetical protein
LLLVAALILLTLSLAAGGGCAGISITAPVTALTLSEWGSVGCGCKERSEEKVLHVERNWSDLPR